MARKILRVVEAQPMAGFRLALSFNDGSAGVADLNGHMTGVLAPLADPKLFAQAHVERGTVCWPGDHDLAPEYLHALANGLPTPTTADDARANAIAVTLRQLRELAGKTQAEVAAVTGKTQADISRFEARQDVLLTTLREYIEGLGGELELVARFQNRHMLINIG